MYALFNKDKIFIGFSPEIPHKSLLSKKLAPEQNNIKEWRWEGDYDSGGMVSLNAGYPAEEIELERMLFDYINKKYPFPVQLLNIMNQLRKIVENNDSLQDDSFMDMSDCIRNAVDKHNKRVNYYKNYSIIIPKNESKQNVFDKN